MSRHRDELSSQRGFSTCRMTPTLRKIRKIWQIRKTPVQYHTSVVMWSTSVPSKPSVPAKSNSVRCFQRTYFFFSFFLWSKVKRLVGETKMSISDMTDLTWTVPLPCVQCPRWFESTSWSGLAVRPLSLWVASPGVLSQPPASLGRFLGRRPFSSFHHCPVAGGH